MLQRMLEIVDEVQSQESSDKYYEYNGYKVPRVTSILSKCIHVDSLMYWANSLGFKRLSYRKTLNEAAEIGTQCHAGIDSFFENSIYDIKLIQARNAYNSFLAWWEEINKACGSIKNILHEQTLICKYFGGTLDALFEIDGKKILVDYKTSNHISYKYCLQLAAYRYMLRSIMNIEIDGVVILQLSKNTIGFNEYSLDFNNPSEKKFMDDCEIAFMSLVNSYYNLLKIENGYKTLGWG